MKNVIVMGIAMILMWALPLATFCQVMTPEVPAVDLLNITAYFYSIAALSVLIVPATSFVNRLLKVDGWKKHVLSWAVAVGLGVLAWLLKLGIFTGVDWYWAILYSILAGLVANGIFSIPTIKMILRLIKIDVKVE